MANNERKVIINNKNLKRDLIAITSFFNPSNYKNKKQNFIKFRDNLRKQGVPLLVVECAFGDSDYEIEKEDADIIIRVRSNSKIWQKERLLNIGVNYVPKKIDKFVFLDCDILFQNDNWAVETSKLLEKYPVVQPFEYAYRLAKNQFETKAPFEFGADEGQRVNSFAKAVCGLKNLSGLIVGVPGFAWAFNKKTFPKLYDKMIVGGADAFMAYASFGYHYEAELYSKKMNEDKEKYLENVMNTINGRINYVSGMILHLWHGDRSNRNHLGRQTILKKHNFDPESDLKLNETGCWEIRKEIGKEIERYFDSRKEED